MRSETLSIFVSLACLTACADPSTGDAPTSTTEPTATKSEAVWSRVSPGGDTMCSDGSEFFFLTHAGDPDKLVFFLEGGGGCSESSSCDPEGQPTYKMTLQDQPMPATGIFDFDNSENPFSDYSMVYVPYCTGDVHIGDNDAVYQRPNGETFTVHHRGWPNAKAALDWVFDRSFAPDAIFVTGESAGAIPTPIYASLLADQYGNARIVSLGDGAGGYRYERPVTSQQDRWQMFNFVTQVPGFGDLTPENWSFEQLYIQAGQAFPEITLARFDFASDAAQSWFLGSNSENETLLENLHENNADISKSLSDFRTFIAPSDAHTVLGKRAFYSLSVNDTRLRDWVADLAIGERVDDILCEGCQASEQTSSAEME